MGRSCPLYRVPFSSRKQLKPLQKVPSRPPRILSSCHLKTMWTRACPGLFSLSPSAPASCLKPPHSRHTYTVPASRHPFGLLRTSGSPSSVPTCPTSWAPDLGYQGTEDGQEVAAKQPTLPVLCPLLTDPANRPRWLSTAGPCLERPCSQIPWKIFL